MGRADQRGEGEESVKGGAESGEERGRGGRGRSEEEGAQ